MWATGPFFILSCWITQIHFNSDSHYLIWGQFLTFNTCQLNNFFLIRCLLLPLFPSILHSSYLIQIGSSVLSSQFMVIRLKCEGVILNFLFYFLKKWHITWGAAHGVVVSTVTSQQEGSRFNSHPGPFCVEFACSPRVCVGSLWVLRLPATVQKHACL